MTLWSCYQHLNIDWFSSRRYCTEINRFKSTFVFNIFCWPFVWICLQFKIKAWLTIFFQPLIISLVGTEISLMKFKGQVSEIGFYFLLFTVWLMYTDSRGHRPKFHLFFFKYNDVLKKSVKLICFTQNQLDS